MVVFCDLADKLTITESDNYNLEVSGRFASDTGDNLSNLVTRAVNLLASLHKKQPRFKIELVKNIPVGGGLGGGSSDAAAILRFLRDSWELKHSDNELAKIGLQLGADIPASISSQPSIVTGIGETVRPLKNFPDSLYVLLVNPGIHISSTEIYKKGFKKYSESAHPQNSFKNIAELIEFLAHTSNDLTENAISTAPVIAEVVKIIASCKGCLLSRMSGSGSTCFGLFENKKEAASAAKKISNHNSSWWIKSSKIMN